MGQDMKAREMGEKKSYFYSNQAKMGSSIWFSSSFPKSLPYEVC